MALLSASSLNNRFTQLGLAAVFVIALLWFWTPSFEAARHISVPGLSHTDPPPPRPKLNVPPEERKPHAIDVLVKRAQEEHVQLLQKESKTLQDAVQAYKDKRGRQPPPHFDLWFDFAKNKSAVIVEEFFDQIYHDLTPFWAVPAKQIRESANDYLHRISVRNGNTTERSNEKREWLTTWREMVQSVAPMLPDLDMAVNEMDESRMVVPWEEINRYVEKEAEIRRVVPQDELVKTRFGNLKELDNDPPEKFDPEFDGRGPYWQLAVVGCHPESPARKAFIETDFTSPPPLITQHPPGSYHGYVQNWTLARSPCEKAELQGLHGTFVEPISISNTKRYFPLFGGSKLPMNNEILFPPAMYWSKNPFYSGGDDHGPEWEKKRDLLTWRGSASGGRNKRENWTRFQRHRFVSMVNATSVRLAENEKDKPPNFVLPDKDVYDLAGRSSTSKPGDLADWLHDFADAGVVSLECFPNEGTTRCSYTNHYFFVQKSKPMKEQYSSKYLPDLDGNSFSGRYRGFLRSTSLPIKATIYQEWHDSRLIPWRHFVPMDNTFIDIYGIMEYFLGNDKAGVPGHDDVAKDIALGGKSWAEKVLRREDMQIYVFRLLLEYARLCDDDREKMGMKEPDVG